MLLYNMQIKRWTDEVRSYLPQAHLGCPVLDYSSTRSLRTRPGIHWYIANLLGVLWSLEMALAL